MKIVIVKYGIGYGRHELDLEFEDDATDEEIDSDIEATLTERLDWSWELAE